MEIDPTPSESTTVAPELEVKENPTTIPEPDSRPEGLPTAILPDDAFAPIEWSPRIASSLSAPYKPLSVAYIRGGALLLSERFMEASGWSSNHEVDYEIMADRTVLLRLRSADITRATRAAERTRKRALALSLAGIDPNSVIGGVGRGGRARTDGLIPGSDAALLADQEKRRASRRESMQRTRERLKQLNASLGLPQRARHRPLTPPKRTLSDHPAVRQKQIEVWLSGGPAADTAPDDHAAPPRAISATTARASIPGMPVTAGERAVARRAEQKASQPARPASFTTKEKKGGSTIQVTPEFMAEQERLLREHKQRVQAQKQQSI